MALWRINGEPPVRRALVDRLGLLSDFWKWWYQLVAQHIQGVSRETISYDPPSIPSGGLHTASVPHGGAVDGDFVTSVSFTPMTVGGVGTPYIRVIGNVIANKSVGVTFINAGPGAIDLDAGTLRIQVERAT